jgi:hypothetical protein
MKKKTSKIARLPRPKLRLGHLGEGDQTLRNPAENIHVAVRNCFNLK